jgi:hypothetical protein
MELLRRGTLPGSPGAATGTLKESDQQIVTGAENPLFPLPKLEPKETNRAVQICLDLKSRSSTPQ